MNMYLPKKKKDHSLFYLFLAFVIVLSCWYVESTFVKAEASEITLEQATVFEGVPGDLEVYKTWDAKTKDLCGKYLTEHD